MEDIFNFVAYCST